MASNTKVRPPPSPPPPRTSPRPGAFDAHPKAHRLRDGREVYFAGAGISSNPDASAEKETPLPVGPGSGALRDPVDFDISRKGVSEKWQGDGEGKTPAVSTEDRALAAARSAEGRSEKERSLCGLCRRRFAGVSCLECRLAYCFRWAMMEKSVLLLLVGTGVSVRLFWGAIEKAW